MDGQKYKQKRGRTKEDGILLARLEDLQNQAVDRYMIAGGHFLDAHQRKLAEEYCRQVGYFPSELKLSTGQATENVQAREQTSSRGDQLNERQASVRGDQLSEGQASVRGNLLSEGQASVRGDLLSEGQTSVRGDQLSEGQTSARGNLRTDWQAQVHENPQTGGKAQAHGHLQTGEQTGVLERLQVYAHGNGAVVFYGGYPDAERCMPVFLPEYAVSAGYNIRTDLEEMIRVVRVYASKETVSNPKRRGGLSHRDYLGALLALGLDREVTGDILVRGEDSSLGPGADIIVQTEMADFIQLNFEKAGRSHLRTEVLPIRQLHLEPVRMQEQHDTVASLRLDNIVASAFRLSRAKAGEAIRRGLVAVNSVEALKVDRQVEEGDRIALRGQGKARLMEIGAATRKERIRVTLGIYL